MSEHDSFASHDITINRLGAVIGVADMAEYQLTLQSTPICVPYLPIWSYKILA